MLYKYLNPNLLSFVTVDQSSLDTGKTAVSINILDAVSGNLYYHGVADGAGPASLSTDFSRFSGTSGGVNIILCENWLVATYYNHGPLASFKGTRANSKNVELFVVELFESEFPDDRLDRYVYFPVKYTQTAPKTIPRFLATRPILFPRLLLCRMALDLLV